MERGIVAVQPVDGRLCSSSPVENPKSFIFLVSKFDRDNQSF